MRHEFLMFVAMRISSRCELYPKRTTQKYKLKYNKLQMKSFLPSSIILYFHHHHHLSQVLLLMSLIKYSKCTYQTFSTSHIGSARGLQTSFSSREWQGCSLSPWCRSSASAGRSPPPSGPRTAPAGRLHSPHTWKWSRSKPGDILT